jgi:hypothetical protein
VNTSADKLKQAVARNAEMNDHVAEVAAEQQAAQEKEAQQREPKGGENGNAGTGS